MKKLLLLLFCFTAIQLFAQNDTINIIEDKKVEVPPIKVFYSQKLINAKTVEVLRKGVLDFTVSHNFGDISGSEGGISRFFGLDNVADVKISFQLGLSDRFNLIAARTRGANIYVNSYSVVQQLWELGLKWQLAKQAADSKHPLSITVFANTVVSTMEAFEDDSSASNFDGFSDRLSQAVQLMIARKIGNVSLQVSPTYVHRNLVMPGDEKSMFAIGGAARIPLSKKIIFLVDYFHTFRPESGKKIFDNPNSAAYRYVNRDGSHGTRFYDPIGIGFEILTEGHVFHLNFTNATELLENRFIPRTVTRWGSGQYRWGFTLTRNFVLFRDKKGGGEPRW